MSRVRTYHRPEHLDAALTLLARTDVPTRALGGGTIVNADSGLGSNPAPPVDVVDLQALGLSGISESAGEVRIGATATLQAIADHACAPDVIRTLARREQPSTMRTLATLGGTVAQRDWESELIAGLLAFDAVVHWRTVSTDGTATATDALPHGALITMVSIQTGDAVVDRTGRTPADVAIVSAVARRRVDGTIALALSGVSATPLLVDGPDAAAHLTPPGDFRGSSDYRRHLAQVLATRVCEKV